MFILLNPALSIPAVIMSKEKYYSIDRECRIVNVSFVFNVFIILSYFMLEWDVADQVVYLYFV